MNRYQATEIEWETDGHDDVFLPTDIDIPDSVAIDKFGRINYGAIEKYLSDTTGFCHHHFVVVELARAQQFDSARETLERIITKWGERMKF